ncbi:MAG: histidinol-phosphatase [Actinobacteria bacterium]|nr:histidinol-phosphatase [Actinomycetota bacterium]MCL5446053.1 histidinol-phosphatase [Actinomycetota bacterium]
MIDYHLHLWPHNKMVDSPLPTIDHLAAYCSKAQERGVAEIAITEHFFRFKQAMQLLPGLVASEKDDALASSMVAYFEFHARSDLDAYVEYVLAAKHAGLPVRLGLEVDYYAGSMDRVSYLLSGYPFDVLLGSVHWLGTWRFDDLDDPLSMQQWNAAPVETIWRQYANALSELLDTGTCDVVAHPDVIKVTGQKPPQNSGLWDQLAEIISRSGMAAELSSAGWRKPAAEPYPSPELFSRLVKLGVSFTTASDSHSLGLVADQSDRLRSILTVAGVNTIRTFSSRSPLDVPL